MVSDSSVLNTPNASMAPKRGLKHASWWAAAAMVALAGCSSAPLSYLNDGYVYHRAVLNRFPVRVVAVDGNYTAFRPVPVAPGVHNLLIAAAPVAGFRVPLEKTYPMNIEPCTRYYVAAQRTSPLLQDWELVVEESYPVAGCNPAQEVEKAKTAAISGMTPQGSSFVESSASSSASAVVHHASR